MAKEENIGGSGPLWLKETQKTLIILDCEHHKNGINSKDDILNLKQIPVHFRQVNYDFRDGCTWVRKPDSSKTATFWSEKWVNVNCELDGIEKTRFKNYHREKI